MPKTKRCGLCGVEFACWAGWGCWCASVRVPKERLRRLSQIVSDCVCPRCLTEAKL